MIELVIDPSESPGIFWASWNSRALVKSRTPLLSGARALLVEGMAPEIPLQMRHAGSEIVSMRTTVGAAARLTIEEGRHSPRFVAWKPLEINAVRHRAADLDSPATPIAES